MVVVGEPSGVSRALAELGRARDAVQQPVAACVLGALPRADLGVPVAVGADSVPALVRRHAADVVLVVPSAELSPPALRRLLWSLEDTEAELFLATGLLDVAAVRARSTVVGRVAALHVTRAELHGARRAVKEVVERVLALVVFLVLAPLLLVLMAVVRLDSPGPAIYRQQRIGLQGRPFTMLKLRTMVAGAEARVLDIHELNQADGLLFKVHGDPRVTGVGRFLRRYSLDELPQLWNVIVGEMALVGPRPALPSEVVKYDEDVRRRMVVKPGLTGLWQVSGRSDLTWEDSVRLDLHYVDNWSLGLDLVILCRTVRAVLGHQGAY
jgi:exopolysaccharide biosynthesis polyprenyl glycosylphosphotransferase